VLYDPPSHRTPQTVSQVPWTPQGLEHPAPTNTLTHGLLCRPEEKNKTI